MCSAALSLLPVGSIVFFSLGPIPQLYPYCWLAVLFFLCSDQWVLQLYHYCWLTVLYFLHLDQWAFAALFLLLVGGIVLSLFATKFHVQSNWTDPPKFVGFDSMRLCPSVVYSHLSSSWLCFTYFLEHHSVWVLFLCSLSVFSPPSALWSELCSGWGCEHLESTSGNAGQAPGKPHSYMYTGTYNLYDSRTCTLYGM